METLRKGARGEAVKILQKALGITQDGIFGAITETYIKSFQKKVGLVADGIVGVKTWAALGIAEGKTSATGVEIIHKPLSVHVSRCASRQIKYIAIHFTGSSHSRKGRAVGTYETFCKRQASADFCVDDEQIVCFNPDIRNYYCWAVGDKPYGNKGGKLYGIATNRNTISIELCSTCTPSTSQAVSVDNHKGWSFTTAVLDNAVKLCRMLMKEYNIPIERVVRHYDISGKLCPGIMGWNDEPIKDINGKKTGFNNNSLLWEAFKKRLA